MSMHYYRPEMGDTKPENMAGTVSHAFGGGHYFVRTTLELKGRGITCVMAGETNRYRVTNRAMEILEKKHDFAMEMLFD